MKETKIPPVHPGEVLLEDFLKPLEISQYRLAKEMKFHLSFKKTSMLLWHS